MYLFNLFDYFMFSRNVKRNLSYRIPALYCVGCTLHQLLEDNAANPNIVEHFLEKVLRSVENYAGEGALEVVNILIVLTNHAAGLANLNIALVTNIVEVCHRFRRKFFFSISLIFILTQVICTILQHLTVDLPQSVELSKDLEEVG